MATDTDPRVARSQSAIIAGARRLLMDHGPGAVTHARVAEVAGIGRATVYRHWPRSDQLLAEAMATVPLPFFDSPTAPTLDWMRTQLTALAHELDLPDVRAVTTTLANASLWDQEMDIRRAGFAQLLARRLEAALETAKDRGEISLSVVSNQAAALVIGPLYYRATIERASIDDRLIAAAVNALGIWND